MLRLMGALLLLAALAGGVLYYGNDLWKNKIDRSLKEITEWTPDNITRNPEGYLEDAIVALEKMNTKLTTHKRTLTIRLELAEQKQKMEKRSLEASTLALGKLKDAYQANESTFPVSLDREGPPLSEEVFQKRVVGVDQKAGMHRENVARLDASMAHLRRELARTEETMQKLIEQREYVQQQLDHLKLDLAIGSAAELTAKADEIAATAKALRAEPSRDKQEAVELVKAEENKLQGQSVKDRFEQIMGSK